MLTLHLWLDSVLSIASLFMTMSMHSLLFYDRRGAREQQMHVHVCISFFWNSSFCVERTSKMWSSLAKKASQKKNEVDISQPNLKIVTCWGLALNQKAEPDNPHNDPEELFSSPPIHQKFTLHPFTTKELLYFPFSLSIFLSFS